MLNVVKKLFILLTPSQRKQFYGLQVLVVLMAFMEIIGVVSVIPFMTLIGDMDRLQQDTIIARIYKASGSTSESQFALLLGVAVLLMLFISSLTSMFTTWRLSIFATKVGQETSIRLYAHYLQQGWLFHASGSSAQLTKKIAIESGRVSTGIIMPLMQINARIVLTLFLGLSIFLYDPKVAIVALFIFAIAYFILFKLVRLQLQRNGKAISELNEERFRLMNEGFGGIKDLLLLGRGYDFIKRFNKTAYRLAYSQGTNIALTQVPRYFMELVAFGSMISLVLYLIANYDGNLGMVLPVLSVYALAAFKLLPAFQQIYSSIAVMKASIPAFESIQQDLVNLKKTSLEATESVRSYLHPKKRISLDNLTFTYPGKNEPTLKQINLSIAVNSVIGIVGPSGSGKSTLIDILLGLIDPQIGQLKVDNKIINDKNRRSWQNTLGFVAQSIFLSEGTIAENVAFGIPQDQIDYDQVQHTLELAHLNELVKSFELGIHTKVGERGVKLSGGQRQRIGIARALYHEAEVLVFDEATSSLDGLTEKLIMEAINNFSGKKTIILIAHRLKTVQKCDQIFFIDNGQVVDQGTYQKLIETNKYFRNMALHA